MLMHINDVSIINDLGVIDFMLLKRTKDYLMINDHNLNSTVDNYLRKDFKEKDKLLQELAHDIACNFYEQLQEALKINYFEIVEMHSKRNHVHTMSLLIVTLCFACCSFTHVPSALRSQLVEAA